MDTIKQATPGPWKVDASRRPDIEIVGRPTWKCMRNGMRGEWTVATIEQLDEDSSEAEANARLIAAAPDLLYALKFMLEDGWIEETEHVALAAIAKAEGR